MRLLPLLLLVFSLDAAGGKIKGGRIDQGIELPYHHPRSMIGQDPITAPEVNMCNDLKYQADWGPLSHRINKTGSIGTCSPKSGVCAIYWIDTDLCDIIDTADMAVDRRYQPPKPQKSKVQQLQDAVDHCYSDVPKFGPQAPCEHFEKMLEEELMK